MWKKETQLVGEPQLQVEDGGEVEGIKNEILDVRVLDLYEEI
jgi:hypothetical protein